ncbi:phosphoglycerate mutase [Candidatus Micrarchaeota archaeon]|nr:MAG: phosphoglycerate mutase [Candidatus Micrarchaeota archaeon]
MKQIIYLLLDGLGDYSYAELGIKTPLEYANTPFFDSLASGGKEGLIVPTGLGREILMENASLMLFSDLGYDLRTFPHARGIIEAVGHGFDVKDGELWARTNFATVDENWVLIDLRAGRISQTEELVKAVNEIQMDVEFHFYGTQVYRGLLVFRDDKALSDEITGVDPHMPGKKVMMAKALKPEAKRSAELINDFMKKAYEVLKQHPINIERREMGLPEANFILPRGIGSKLPHLQPFEERHNLKAVSITGINVNKGISKLLGIPIWEVPEEIGEKEYEVKREPILKAIDQGYDFISVHVKPTDDAGHDGDVHKKVREIERADAFFSSLELDDVLWAIYADHCTPCFIKAHSNDLIPSLISSKKASGRQFAEKYCTDYTVQAYDFIKLALKEAR